MSKIEYITNVIVKLDGKAIGTIKPVKYPNGDPGWQYFPKGTKIGGDIYSTLATCQLSLGSEWPGGSV